MTHSDANLSFAWLGLLLQVLRVRRGITLAEMAYLLDADLSCTSATTYGEIEVGHHLPRDSQRFLQAYESALGLSDDEANVLLSLWAFAILSQELGEGMAHEVVRVLIEARATAMEHPTR